MPTASLVVDASVVVQWFRPEPGHETSRDLLGRATRTDLLAIPIMRMEVANVLLRRYRLPRAEVAAADRLVDQATIEVDLTRYERRLTIELAADYGLTIYDALYAAVAAIRELPLATRDGALLRAGLGVEPEALLDRGP